MKKKILACPDCQKKFDNLPSLNKHIAKVKCNDGIKIDFVDVLDACGLLKIKIGNQTVDLMKPLLAI